MSVRPVEFTGMIQNTHDLSSSRTAEQSRPQAQQEQVAQNTAQQAAVSTTQVAESAESARDFFDPSNGGDGTGYQGNNKKKDEKEKKKKKPISDGAVKLKDGRMTFDATV